jgi:hypothetical protein
MSNVQIPEQLSQWREKLLERQLDPAKRLLWIDVSEQRLLVCEDDHVLVSYAVSTALKGTGCAQDSYQTPTGLHRISVKIGADEPSGMIFRGREPTGELANIEQADVDTGRDLITSRILWLDGLEPGVNHGGSVDTRDRYIYIHGTNEEGRIGQAVSHGCIRMNNRDVVDLYDRIDTGTPVIIVDG